MRLRPFRPSDLQTLYEIDRSCFPSGISYSREELARFIRHRRSKTWVAQEEDGIVGFVIAERQPAHVGHIVTIDVVDRWRHRGVGTALMNAAEEWAGQLDLQLIYLETAEDNVAAHRFYEARGYNKVERVERYYADGTAAWVMAKWLK